MKIAIVNDMLTAVEALRRALLIVPGFELAWIAGNGEEAVQKCLADTPDLILMDLYMPVMDGVEATRRIMAEKPCPILVVTASMEGNSGKVFSALGAGALDAVRTPILGPGWSYRRCVLASVQGRSNRSDPRRWTRTRPGTGVKRWNKGQFHCRRQTFSNRRFRGRAGRAFRDSWRPPPRFGSGRGHRPAH